jgi:hypothetical protein
MDDAPRATHVQSDLLATVELQRTSYCYFWRRLEPFDKQAAVRALTANSFERAYRCCGSRRMHARQDRLSVDLTPTTASPAPPPPDPRSQKPHPHPNTAVTHRHGPL